MYQQGGGKKLSWSNCYYQLLLLKLVCHFILWLIPLLLKAYHYQLHFISPLIYMDKKVSADQSAVTVVSLCQLITNNENIGGEMRYFLERDIFFLLSKPLL